MVAWKAVMKVGMMVVNSAVKMVERKVAPRVEMTVEMMAERKVVK